MFGLFKITSKKANSSEFKQNLKKKTLSDIVQSFVEYEINKMKQVMRWLWGDMLVKTVMYSNVCACIKYSYIPHLPICVELHIRIVSIFIRKCFYN